MPKPVQIFITGLLMLMVNDVFAEDLVLKPLEKAVEETELAFAKTMEQRDFEAFKTFLSEEAVFFSGERVLNGKQQVADAWQAYFEDEQAPFSWFPDQVVVLDSGLLAHSSGPVLNPAGERIATFNSIWRFDPASKKWQIVFDKGSQFCGSAKP